MLIAVQLSLCVLADDSEHAFDVATLAGTSFVSPIVEGGAYFVLKREELRTT